MAAVRCQWALAELEQVHVVTSFDYEVFDPSTCYLPRAGCLENA